MSAMQRNVSPDINGKLAALASRKSEITPLSSLIFNARLIIINNENTHAIIFLNWIKIIFLINKNNNKGNAC
jgi:hypothetical protein